MKLSRFVHAAMAAGVLAIMAGASHAQQVDVELALLVDESASVNETEYFLQLFGYRDAFRDPGIQNAITNTTNGIAVSLMVFSGAAEQQIEVPWTQLHSALDCENFADAIDAAVNTRPFSGFTGIAEAIDFAVNSINTNTFISNRRTIDVSGDGEQNTLGNGTPTPADVALLNASRNAAFSSGITINGLAINTPEFLNLDDYYAANVVTPNGFVITATSFDSFAGAVRLKIVTELAGAPEPGTFALLGVGALAFGGFLARRKKA